MHPLNDDSYPITLNGNEMEITVPPGNFVTTVIRHDVLFTGEAH